MLYTESQVGAEKFVLSRAEVGEFLDVRSSLSSAIDPGRAPGQRPPPLPLRTASFEGQTQSSANYFFKLAYIIAYHYGFAIPRHTPSRLNPAENHQLAHALRFGHSSPARDRSEKATALYHVRCFHDRNGHRVLSR